MSGYFDVPGERMAKQRTCENCANYKSKNTWTAKVQRFGRIGDGPLTQTYPEPAIKATRSKSATRARLEQALAVGACCSLCILPFSLTYAASVFLTASTGTYVLSVALGKENQDALFKLLDRNNDGRLSPKDLPAAVELVLDRVLEPEDETMPAPQSTTDRIQLGYEISRWMPDRTLHRAVLLPEHPRYIGKEKLRQAARAHEINDGECNFSKRGCGEPFGDDLAQVQDELERLGYIQREGKAKNAPRVWTPEGERWLERF